MKKTIAMINSVIALTDVLLVLLAILGLLGVMLGLQLHHLKTQLDDSRANVIECQSRLDSALAEISLSASDKRNIDESELALRDQADWIINTEDQLFDCLEAKTVPLTDKACALRCGCYSALMVENTWEIEP